MSLFYFKIKLNKFIQYIYLMDLFAFIIVNLHVF